VPEQSLGITELISMVFVSGSKAEINFIYPLATSAIIQRHLGLFYSDSDVSIGKAMCVFFKIVFSPNDRFLQNLEHMDIMSLKGTTTL
jgi:hypothetical protein